MNTNAARVASPENKAAAKTSVQKKASGSETLAFEDQRESSLAQSSLQMKINQSPRLISQRKQLTAAFGPEISVRSKGDSVAQKVAKPSVVQRDPFDGPLVDFIKRQGRHATTAYDLLVDQVESCKTQVMMLEFYSGPVEDQDNSELAAAKSRIAETSEAVNGDISYLPEEVGDARATACALAEVVSLETPHDLFEGWMHESLDAVQEVAFAQAKTAGILERIKKDAVKMATIAMEAHEIHMMRGLLKVADDSAAAAASGDQVVAQLTDEDGVASSVKEKLGLATTMADATNNVSTGVVFGLIGALDAGGVFSLSTVAGTALGVIGGVLGLFFGAIGVFLGVKNAIRGAQSKKKLKNAKSIVSNSELEAIADYAINQKEKKILGNAAATVGGLAAIGAGVIGLIALSVATFGIGAIVAGIGAALIGLGILGFRIIHHWQKRKAERKAFADELIAQVQGDEENAGQARTIISSVGMDPEQVGQPSFRKNLAGNLKGYVKSKRTRMAEGLVKSLIAGKPSEIFDSELILGALGVDPEWIKAQVDAEKSNKAVSKVAGKLASW